jgi:hypothetical protein
MCQHSRWLVLALGAWFLTGGGQAQADLIQSDLIQSVPSTPTQPHLGSYTGTLTYEASSSTAATLTITLKNTTNSTLGGDLTAFVFNNPGGQITSASLSTTTHFLLMSGSNSINAGPYGYFDFGATTGGAFEGGGNPSLGLAPGQTGKFTFNLTGTGLGSLTGSDFFSTLSVGPGDGQGDQAFVARFRGFIPDGSDKVPGVDPPGPPQQAPEPGSLILAALSGLGLVGLVRARRQRSSAQPG